MAAQSPPLAGRVAIVTSSSRGIGRAIAIHLAELGARVVVNYTTKSSDADLVAAEINGLPAVTGNGPRAIMVQANVSEPSHVTSLFDAAEKYLQSVLEKAQETLGKQNLGEAGLEAAKVHLSEFVSKVSAEYPNTSFLEQKEFQNLCTQQMQPPDFSLKSCLGNMHTEIKYLKNLKK